MNTVSIQQHLKLLDALSIVIPSCCEESRLGCHQLALSRREALGIFWTSPDGMGGNLVPVGPQVLNLLVVGPLVRHVERGRDRAAVRVLAARLEHLLVQLAVNVVDRVVEGEEHQLRSGLGCDAA